MAAWSRVKAHIVAKPRLPLVLLLLMLLLLLLLHVGEASKAAGKGASWHVRTSQLELLHKVHRRVMSRALRANSACCTCSSTS